MRTLRPFAVGLAAATALVLASGGAFSADPGDLAPELEVKEVFLCEEASIQAQRGRILLLELFSTT